MYRHILLPTDGSPLSESGIRNGVEVAKSFGARVTGFYVIRKPQLEDFEGYAPDTKGAVPTEEMDVQDAKGYLAVIEKHAKAMGVPCEVTFARNESPHNAIVQAAQERGCDLIIMSSHGRTGPTGDLLGSETQKVLLGCKIPVLVYR
ncbi:MAG: universal stress protein [Betaproteobacteria bacterium]|nr:universal stress protein [Betaproteobacteria bacterium]